MFFEDWKLWGGSRLKSVIIVVLAFVVILGWCPKESMEVVSNSVYQPADWAGDQQSELSKDWLAGTAGEYEGVPADIFVQVRLEESEQEFHEIMEKLGEENYWSAQYTKEAEEYYLKFAESMSWVTAYWECDLEAVEPKGDLLLIKGEQKAEMIRQQTEWTNGWLEEK